MKFWIIGLLIAGITAFMIFKKAKEESQQLSPSDIITPRTTTISATETIFESPLTVNSLVRPFTNDYTYPYWRTDYNPALAPLIDSFNAYQPYNLRPVYGSIGGPTDYYQYNKPQVYYYDSSRVPDLLLNEQQRYPWNIANTRQEQALYGNLSNNRYDLLGW